MIELSEPLDISMPDASRRSLAITVRDLAKKRGKRSKTFTVQAPKTTSAEQFADGLEAMLHERAKSSTKI